MELKRHKRPHLEERIAKVDGRFNEICLSGNRNGNVRHAIRRAI